MIKKLSQYVHGIFYSDGVNSLPVRVMGLLFLLNVTCSMTITMIYSFLPKMVKHFGATEISAGKDVGLIASVLFVSRILTSLCWGYLSDKRGRKTVLMIMTSGLALSTLLFGFSTTFCWALTTRFLQGCFNGILVVAKAIVADVCDETNFPLGLSILVSANSLGLILGPGIGGYLAFPAEQYPNVFSINGIFGTFVILLPLLLLFSLFIVSIVLLRLSLPKGKMEANDCIQLVSSPSARARVTYSSFKPYQVLDNPHSKVADDYWNVSFSAQSDTTIFDPEFFYIAEYSSTPGKKLPHANSFSMKYIRENNIFRLLRSKDCIALCVLYTFFSFAAVGSNELFPLFSATSVEYTGLGFSPTQIGNTLLIAAVSLLVLQTTLLSRVLTVLGSKKTLIISTLVFATVFPLLPLLPRVKNKRLFAFFVQLLVIIQRSAVSLCYLALNILLNNTVSADLRGSMNGLAMSVSCVGRMLAPITYGNIFSWSLQNVMTDDNGSENIGFPFNQYLVFLVNSLWLGFITALSCFIPERLNRKTGDRRNEKEITVEDDNRTADNDKNRNGKGEAGREDIHKGDNHGELCKKTNIVISVVKT